MIYQGIDALPPGTGVLWSLAVEEHFYLLFPLLYFVLRRSGLSRLGQAGLLWALCGAFALWRLVLIYVLHASMDHVILSTDSRFDSILWGCALAIWGNPAIDETRFSQRTWTFVLLPLGLAGLGATYLVPAREALKYTVMGIALAPIFCAVIRYPGWGPIRLLNSKFMVLYGVLSYSFYLVHAVLLRVLEERSANVALTAPLGFVCAFGLAYLMHRVIERPANRLRHNLPAAKPASAQVLHGAPSAG
jgi:peptidoglycan/LPS O-acetylase OafA/YrhL